MDDSRGREGGNGRAAGASVALPHRVGVALGRFYAEGRTGYSAGRKEQKEEKKAKQRTGLVSTNQRLHRWMGVLTVYV